MIIRYYIFALTIVAAITFRGQLYAAQIAIKERSLLQDAARGNLEGVQSFLKTNINIDEHILAEALRNAASNGRARVVKQLIKAGANPNIQDEQGRTALMVAASTTTPSGDVVKKIVIELLNAGANPHLVNEWGKDVTKLLQTWHPYLLKDQDIKKALQRFDQYKKEVAKQIEASIEEVHFPSVLADITAEYAVKRAAAVPAEEAKKNEQQSRCIIN